MSLLGVAPNATDVGNKPIVYLPLVIVSFKVYEILSPYLNDDFDTVPFVMLPASAASIATPTVSQLDVESNVSLAAADVTTTS